MAFEGRAFSKSICAWDGSEASRLYGCAGDWVRSGKGIRLRVLEIGGEYSLHPFALDDLKWKVDIKTEPSFDLKSGVVLLQPALVGGKLKAAYGGQEQPFSEVARSLKRVADSTPPDWKQMEKKGKLYLKDWYKLHPRG